VSTEAWNAFATALINILIPLFCAGCLGWMLRGGVDARRRRNERKERMDETP
jgi:hypothetical protein